MRGAHGRAARSAALAALLLTAAGAPAPVLALGEGAAPAARPDDPERHADGVPAYLPELLARARADGLAAQPGWLRLLHYRRTLTGGWKSEIDGPEFFRAPGGKTDPAAELEATLAGFFDDRPVKDELDDAQCRFPARLRWLSDRLGLDPARLPRRDCPRREKFMRQLDPRGVTLVFSSYYLNNPASAFGHTLLRFDKAQEAIGGKHFELLDTGVDYAATVDTPNALLYAFKGLFGLFKGEFKAYAYYYKVREYGDFESRDLWEYDLALTPDELALLADHVWELGGTYLWYWYLDENCSYHVLGALEAAAPRLDLLSHVGRFVVLPSDTIHALHANPGLVKAVHYRPSLRTQFHARARGLDAPTAHLVEALAGAPATPLPAALSDAGRVAVLDAAVDLVDLRHARELLLGKDPAIGAQRQALLVQRAAIAVPSAPLELPVPDAERPELGHGSMRAGAGAAAVKDRGGAAVLEFRLALHDLADPPQGFPALAQIEFLPTRLRWFPQHGRVELDDTSLVHIVSLNPLERFDLRPSWRVRLGATTVRDAGCDACLAGVVEGGGGFTLAALGPLDVMAGGDAELLWSGHLSGAGGSALRPGVGPSALARVRFGNAATFLADARWRWLPDARPSSTYLLSGTLRLHVVHGFSLALESRAAPRERSVTGLVLAYF